MLGRPPPTRNTPMPTAAASQLMPSPTCAVQPRIAVNPPDAVQFYRSINLPPSPIFHRRPAPPNPGVPPIVPPSNFAVIRPDEQARPARHRPANPHPPGRANHSELPSISDPHLKPPPTFSITGTAPPADFPMPHRAVPLPIATADPLPPMTRPHLTDNLQSSFTAARPLTFSFSRRPFRPQTWLPPDRTAAPARLCPITAARTNYPISPRRKYYPTPKITRWRMEQAAAQSKQGLWPNQRSLKAKISHSRAFCLLAG